MMEKNGCENCNQCCKHVVVEIDTPKNKDDYNEILWFLCHENMWVYVDEDSDWNLEIKSPCKYLKDNRCSIYEERPETCRDYTAEECELHGEGEYYTHMFKTREEFLKYMEENNIKFE